MPHNDSKHRAKRWNERVKLIATLFNALAVVTVAAVIINPAAANQPLDLTANGAPLLLLAALTAHLVAQYALAFFDAEE